MQYIRGKVTRQAHVDLPEGTVEEEFGRDGFFGRVSHLYRTQAPVGWSRIEGPLRPHAIRADELFEPGLDYLKARVPVLHNDDVTISVARLDSPMPYYFRNADADELLFVHGGGGRIETDFGPLQYETGDYLVIPRGAVYRLLPADSTRLFIVACRDEIRLPERGALGRHAIFDPAVMNVPTPEAPPEEDRDEWEVRVLRCGELTSIFYPFNPLNAVGWKGDLTVWQLNIRDIRPIACESYHLPPSVHTTFVAGGVVVCSFLPRPLETGDPGALRVPFYHANIDYDEVIFYHDGDFFSREGIAPGMLTFHPQGIHHGPQQGAVEAAKTKTRTNEKAVMIDTRRPLHLTDEAKRVEWGDYWKSWQQRAAGARR